MLQRREYIRLFACSWLTVDSFGDVKYSGIGREGSKYGIEEYLTMKTIVSAVLPPRAML